MKLDVICTKHGWIWNKIVNKLELLVISKLLVISNECEYFFMSFNIMRFANDEVNLETKHICYQRWQLSWHCDNYLILCLTKPTRKSHEVCQPVVILCWYHLENLGLHNKTKDIIQKPCINVVWTQGEPFKFYKSIRQNQENLTFKEVFIYNLSFMSFDILFLD
jgi:hypothetical protein